MAPVIDLLMRYSAGIHGKIMILGVTSGTSVSSKGRGTWLLVKPRSGTVLIFDIDTARNKHLHGAFVLVNFFPQKQVPDIIDATTAVRIMVQRALNHLKQGLEFC